MAAFGADTGDDHPCKGGSPDSILIARRTFSRQRSMLGIPEGSMDAVFDRGELGGSVEDLDGDSAEL